MFQVAIVGNTVAESTEAFTVTITTAPGAPVADGTGLVTIVDNDGALTAETAAPAGETPDALTQEALDDMAEQAKADWLEVEPTSDFTGVTFAIGDLPDLQLGTALDNEVVVDATAAGWGWSTADSGDARFDPS